MIGKSKLRVFWHKARCKKVLLRKYKYILENKRRRIREYPLAIQLPITHLCNFDCVMCGMHHMIERKDFTAEELKCILTDKLFSHIQSVGVNGGEPFLKNDLVDCFSVMLEELPELREFNIISNGFFTDKILEKLMLIKRTAQAKDVKVNLSISVDGINDMQDFHRGKKNAFINADNTITRIMESPKTYVDNINVICTITKYNIARINEVEAWADRKQIEVAYNIATVNERIENSDKLKDFSVFSDEESRMLAQEFFYVKYWQTGNEKYYGLFLFLKESKRFADCPCMYNDWITLTPDAQISFCATHSKQLGSGLENSAYDIVKKNISHLSEIKNNYCKSCSHYIYSLNGEGLDILYKEKVCSIIS